MKASLLKIQIEEDPSLPPGIDLLLPYRVYRKWSLNPSLPLLITLGLRHEKGMVGFQTEHKGLIRMRRSFATRLHLPSSITLYVWFSPEKLEISVGPTFGILLSGVKEEENQRFGIYTSFCNEICRIARSKHVLCYVVPFRNINLEERSVQGWLRGKDGWSLSTLPLPGVLYNRLSLRSEESSPRYASLVESLNKEGGILFNHQFLSKWEVAELLQEEKELQPYLPLSVPAIKLSYIQAMLTHSSVIFLKPYHGSEGRGIVRVRKTPDGYYTDEMQEEGVETHLYPSILPLLHGLRKKVKQKKSLLQKGIPLLSLDGRTVDFRALVQKGRTGEWKVISIVARIARPDLFVSNIAQGGRIENASRLLKQISSTYPNLPPLRKLKSVAKETARRLEKRLSGHYGEFGIDLGLSPTGEIWIIEVNSKPSKKEESMIRLSENPPPSISHLFETIFHYTKIPFS